MAIKQGARSCFLGRTTLLLCLLFGQGLLKISQQSASNFESDEVDLNDVFLNSEILNPHITKRRLEDTTINVLQDNLTSGPKSTLVTKNDEYLPTNLFEEPELPAEVAHLPDPSESEGYRVILNAMKIHAAEHPAVQPAQPTQKVVEARTGLNNALIKLLTITNQFTDNAKPALSASGVTINDLTQYYSSVLFGRKYVETNGTTVVSEPLDDNNAFNFGPLGTVKSVVVEEPAAVVQEVVEEPAVVETVVEEPAVVETVVEEVAPEDKEVSARLLNLVRMYQEHVDLKDSDIVADQEQYGHIKHFSSRLACLVDNDCVFEKHLSATRNRNLSGRHLLAEHMEAHKTFVPSADNPLHQSHLQFVEALNSVVSNEGIKEATSDWINNSQAALTDFENNKWPKNNEDIQASLNLFKTTLLPKLKNITPDELLALLNESSKQYKLEIDKQFTQNGLDEKVQCLVNERNSIESLYNSLRTVIPANGVLHADFERLINSLNRQINTFNKAKQATPEQLENAKIKVKNNLQRQINGIDPVQNAELIRKVSNNLDVILQSDFGKSLNKDNLDFIVHKAITSFHVDLDQMKNPNKASGFMLDKADLEHVTRDVVDELKRDREPGQAVVLNLVDLHKEIQELNKVHSANPTSTDEASNAADILISHEDYLYQQLASDQFYDDLNRYVTKYYGVYIEHMHPLDDFFDYSSAFKTLTNGLNNPNALGVARPVAARALFKTAEKQMSHLYSMTEEDLLFFKVMNHLMAEWALTTDINKFSRKLSQLTSSLMGTHSQDFEVVSIPERHLLAGLFDQVTNSVRTLITDFGNGVQASIGLSNTIGEGQALAQNVASQYQVGDLLTASGTANSGILGSVKNGLSSWFGGRKLDVHYGLTDTIDSVKNLYSNIVEAKKTADQLKDTFQKGKEISDGAQNLASVFSG